jgi:hypothetical protein
LAIVKANIASGGPNAKNVQPKNSIIVIVDELCTHFINLNHF